MKIDAEVIQDTAKKVVENSDVLENIIKKIIIKYCGDLDGYMIQIDERLKSGNLSETELDDIMLNLSALLYFLSDAQEEIGVKEDVAKVLKEETYFQTIEATEGTIAEREAVAKMTSQTETLTHIIYNRTYKRIKLKVEAGYEMLTSVKKVVTRRISERDINYSDTNS